MTAPAWRTSLVVEGFYRDGRRAPVTGLLETAAGDVQLALQSGTRPDDEPVILPLQAGSHLIVNLRDLLLERVRLTGESL